jgi:hypothetical protein
MLASKYSTVKAHFKSALRRCLTTGSLYSVEEFLMFKNYSQPDCQLYIINLV